MSQLYTTTKELTDLIKQVKPEIEIVSDLKISPAIGTPYIHVSNEIDSINAEVLIDLLPQLFTGIENPEREAILRATVGIAIFYPQDLATALSRRYFDYTDGQNMWQSDPVWVLTDLVEEIKKHYKIV